MIATIAPSTAAIRGPVTTVETYAQRANDAARTAARLLLAGDLRGARHAAAAHKRWMAAAQLLHHAQTTKPPKAVAA